MYHVTTRALDQGGVEPRLAVSVRPEGQTLCHYTTGPAKISLAVQDELVHDLVGVLDGEIS